MFLRLFFVASMCQISGKTGGRAMGPHVLFSPFRAPMGHDAMVWSMVHHGSVMGMSRNSVWHQAAIAADPSLTFSLGNYSLVSRGRGLKKWCHGTGKQGKVPTPFVAPSMAWHAVCRQSARVEVMVVGCVK